MSEWICQPPGDECFTRATQMVKRGSTEWPACDKHAKGAPSAVPLREWQAQNRAVDPELFPKRAD